MTGPLEKPQFEELQRKVADGQAKILVSKSVARQFFLRVSRDSVVETTGESLRFQRAVIWTTLAAGIGLMPVTLGGIILEAGWTAAFTVPLLGSFWTVIAGFTSHLGAWIHSAAALICTVILALILPAPWALPFILLATSLILLRIANELAQYWLTALLCRSYPAYDMMAPHITLEHLDQPR